MKRTILQEMSLWSSSNGLGCVDTKVRGIDTEHTKISAIAS